MADLSQQLKDVAAQRKKEKIQRFTRPLQVVGDIATGGAISRGINTVYGRDRGLTEAQKLTAELELAKTEQTRQQRQSQSVANKETVRLRAKDAEEARKKIDSLKRAQAGQLDDSEQKVLTKWEKLHGRKAKGEEWSNEQLIELLGDLRKIPNINAALIIKSIDPNLFQQLAGEQFSEVVADRADLQEARNTILEANLDKDALGLQIQEATGQKAEADRLLAESEMVAPGTGISGVQTGVVTAGSAASLGPSPALYSAGQAVADRIAREPDNRKESAKLMGELALDEDLIRMAEDLGIDPKNSIEMNLFLETAMRANKRAVKVAELAEKNGWTDEEIAQYLYKLPTAADEEGRLTAKVKENRMVWKLLNVDNPDFLRAEAERVAKKHKDRLEERKWENLDLTEAEVYGEDYDPQDTRDLGMPEDLKWLNEEGPDVGPVAAEPEPLPETVAAPEPGPEPEPTFEQPVQESPLTDEVLAEQDAMLEAENANVPNWSAGRSDRLQRAFTPQADAQQSPNKGTGYRANYEEGLPKVSTQTTIGEDQAKKKQQFEEDFRKKMKGFMTPPPTGAPDEGF